MPLLFRAFRFTLTLLLRTAGLFLLLMLLRYSSVPLYDLATVIGVLTAPRHFDYLGWELNAIGVKVGAALFGVGGYLDENARAALVRAYMHDLTLAQTLEWRITLLYSDPAVGDPAAAGADLRAQRDALRADLSARQPLVESILEGQVAALLADLGFALGGQVLPPVSAHFTPVPQLLVVSPRDRISFDVYVNLNAMTADEQAALEDRLRAQFNVAALVVPIGGMALYPAMLAETASLQWALETIAHEWLHHYLFLFPLGYTYDFAGESRIINETTAQLFGREVGRLVLARYYPDLLPPDTPPPAALALPPLLPSAFDFAAAMHQTRVRVDALLAQGRVDDAEAYMERRRRLFVQNGYPLRKLNQAFFAFYGGYQYGAGGGAGGADPIGDAVQDVRAASPSLLAFVTALRDVTTRDALLALRDRLAG